MKKLLLALTVLSMLGIANGSARAQITQNGPYYASPSWDQSLPASSRFIVLTTFNSEAVLDREPGLVREKTPGTDTIVAGQPPTTFADYAALHCMTRKV